jgi:hypothetical protein
MVLLAAGAGAQQTAIFDLRSSFWVNLHQFLCDQAMEKQPPETGSAAWREAVAYYRREVTRHDHLSDEMAALNNRLSQAGNADTVAGTGIDPKLTAVLESVAAEYRKNWWPGHDSANRAWIEAARPLIARYGDVMKREIAAAFQTSWPAAPIRAEIAVKASSWGAYTTTNPTLITMSSTDPGYQGQASLEMLFHEASHSLDSTVTAALDKERTSRNLLFKVRGFNHAVLFYTAGEIARRHLTGYQPYGIVNGVLERGWPGALAVLEKDWKLYLDGKTPFADAIRALVTDYGVPKP